MPSENESMGFGSSSSGSKSNVIPFAGIIINIDSWLAPTALVAPAAPADQLA